MVQPSDAFDQRQLKSAVYAVPNRLRAGIDGVLIVRNCGRWPTTSTRWAVELKFKFEI